MKKINELEKLINEYIDLGAFPGCVYSIVTKEETYMNHLGYKSLIPKKEVNSIDTIYDLASITKVVATTTAILKLLEDEKIALDDKVSKHLPRFLHKEITLLNLLNHTSGLPAGVYGLKDLKTKEEVVNKIYSLDLIYETSSKIVYSDVNFILLGFVVESVTGLSLDKYLEPIYQQMDMKHTCYNPKDKTLCAPTELRDDAIYQGVVQGTVHDETAYLLGGVSGNAGLFSTIKDLSNFILMYLNYGVYNGVRILKKETIDMILNYKISYINEEKNTSTVRSIGWLIAGVREPIGQFASEKTIHHTGFTGGNLWIDFENEVGFCLLTNRVHPTRDNYLHIEARKKFANFIFGNKCFK